MAGADEITVTTEEVMGWVLDGLLEVYEAAIANEDDGFNAYMAAKDARFTHHLLSDSMDEAVVKIKQRIGLAV